MFHVKQNTRPKPGVRDAIRLASKPALSAIHWSQDRGIHALTPVCSFLWTPRGVGSGVEHDEGGSPQKTDCAHNN